MDIIKEFPLIYDHSRKDFKDRNTEAHAWKKFQKFEKNMKFFFSFSFLFFSCSRDFENVDPLENFKILIKKWRPENYFAGHTSSYRTGIFME